MAKTIKVINRLGGQQVVNSMPVSFPVIAGAASTIKTGMLVIADLPVNPGFWRAAADGTTTVTEINAGIATSDSTETVGANGVVTLDIADVMMVSIKAKTPGDLLATMKGVAFKLGVVGSDYVMDEGAPDATGIFTLLDFDNIVDGNCTCLMTTHWRG